MKVSYIITYFPLECDEVRVSSSKMSSVGCARFSDVMLTCFTRAFSKFSPLLMWHWDFQLASKTFDGCYSCRNTEQWTDAQELLLLAKVI